MAKIAVELERAVERRTVTGEAGGPNRRSLAQGAGWSVDDVLCTSGPQDRPFEEQHASVTVALVLSGSFQYHGAAGGELMAPGSLLLGSPGQWFECRHDHGTGDRCLSFSYTPEYFERLAFDAGVRGARAGFRRLRLPPSRAFAGLTVRAIAGLTDTADTAWEEIGVEVAAKALHAAEELPWNAADSTPSTVARVTRVVRSIEEDLGEKHALVTLAERAKLSPYHFLRTFQNLTGLTPHQYVRRARLREAARRLVGSDEKILDIALDCGFGDVSNFNRAFRVEFGVNPRVFRQTRVVDSC